MKRYRTLKTKYIGARFASLIHHHGGGKRQLDFLGPERPRNLVRCPLPGIMTPERVAAYARQAMDQILRDPTARHPWYQAKILLGGSQWAGPTTWLLEADMAADDSGAAAEPVFSASRSSYQDSATKRSDLASR